MKIQTYRPTQTARISAVKFTKENAAKAAAWADGDVKRSMFGERVQRGAEWRVKTLEGWVMLPYGHYLVLGTNDEFYPCDPDVFKNRWEKVDG